jgi:lysozyme family protein
MTPLERALAAVAAHEFSNREDGGLTDDPDDPGGITRFGISLRFLQALDPDATRQDILDMTWPRASAILEVEFWAKHGYGRLPPDVAIKLFDLAVNLGPRQAHICLQRACRAGSDPVEEDGTIGPSTLASVAMAQPNVLVACLRSEAAGVYRMLVTKRPSSTKYLAGWLIRAYA